MRRNYRGSAAQAEALDFEGGAGDALGSTEVGHGRIELREIYVTEDIDWLPQKDKWLNLKSKDRVRYLNLTHSSPWNVEALLCPLVNQVGSRKVSREQVSLACWKTQTPSCNGSDKIGVPIH